jgi:hypothetical protein
MAVAAGGSAPDEAPPAAPQANAYCERPVTGRDRLGGRTHGTSAPRESTRVCALYLVAGPSIGL